VSELFDEVDEELRREQLKKIWEKYSLLIIGAAFLIVAGVGGWRGYEYLETQKAVKASAAFEAASTLADQNKHAEAEAAFSKLAADAPRGYRSMARLRAAAEAVSRDPKAAAKMYDDIAADMSVGVNERDLARVRAAALLLDTDSYDDMAKRLDAATQAGGVYRHTARELLALAAWRAKNIAETRKWLDQIAEDSETPGSLRNRAEALQALLPPAAKS
jgi:hypothetical protein